MTAALYLRVSKEEQHTDNQLPELRAYAKRMEWDAVEYVEHASAKEGSRRPVLAQLIDDAKAKKFGVVVVWKIDRFGRSLIDFVNNVRTLDTAGVRFIAPSQSIDTDQKSPFSKLLMHLLAIFAEFERDLIIERVNAGLKGYGRAYDAGQVGVDKARQSKSGKNKAIGRPRAVFHRGRVAGMRERGMSLRAIGKELGVSEGMIRKALKAA